MLEKLKLSKTLKSSRDDFNVVDNLNVSSIKTAIATHFRCTLQLALNLNAAKQHSCLLYTVLLLCKRSSGYKCVAKPW